MSRQRIERWLLGTLAVILVGCASSGVSTRAYVDNKERVDQQMDDSGYNHGYLMGKSAVEDRSKYQKTRKIFVLEVTKEPKELAEEETKPAAARPRPEPVKINVPERKPQEQPEWSKPIEIPSFEDETPSKSAAPAAAVAEPVGSATEYVVQKGDTLQKISKKFYNTYRKWQKIYEANKDVMKDPNALKVGLKLMIPADGASAPATEENLK
jgi:nucleoid-associated protein YgaU